MYKAIAQNKRRTYMLIAVFIAMVTGLGYIAALMFNGYVPVFTIGALLVASIYALIQYFGAAKLAIKMNGAKEIKKKDYPEYYRTVENLSIAAGMPMPKVYVMKDPAPNAFATGRDPKHGVVCVTTGLLEIMDDTELESVLAHELGHIQNYDIRVMMIVFGLVSAIGLLADMLFYAAFFAGGENKHPVFLIIGLVAALLTPFLAMLVQLAVSRRREYLADSTGALLTRYPEGLASALAKIRDHGSVTKRQNTSTAHLFFANPLKKGFMSGLMSTHPPVNERISRLRNMGL